MCNCITIHGVWMYERKAVASMIELVRAGSIDLGHYDVATFASTTVIELVHTP